VRRVFASARDKTSNNVGGGHGTGPLGCLDILSVKHSVKRILDRSEATD
jgi:hypothetical protein